MNLVEKITQNLNELDYDFNEQGKSLQESIHQYLLLLEKWNKIHNLTAIRDPEEMLTQHIMDSLAVLPHINGPQIVDVGTGPGLPGIPIALARSDWQVALVESNTKKTSFLQQAKIELNLKNIEVVSKRIKDYHPDRTINTIISRAFSSLGTFIDSSVHLNRNNDIHCKWVAMKANCSDQELKQVTTPYSIEKIVTITVPGLAAKRQLIVINKEVT